MDDDTGSGRSDGGISGEGIQKPRMLVTIGMYTPSVPGCVAVIANENAITTPLITT